VSEVALQRAQLEELMQSLSRSRDENLVVDIESALRLAQQQTQLTLSAEPLAGGLRTADQRLARAAPAPAGAPARRGRRATSSASAASVTDVPGVLRARRHRAPGRRAAAGQRRAPTPRVCGEAPSGAAPSAPVWWEQWRDRAARRGARWCG
jgi:uroporphyrin-3 C-methyltransferase